MASSSRLKSQHGSFELSVLPFFSPAVFWSLTFIAHFRSHQSSLF